MVGVLLMNRGFMAGGITAKPNQSHSATPFPLLPKQPFMTWWRQDSLFWIRTRYRSAPPPRPVFIRIETNTRVTGGLLQRATRNDHHFGRKRGEIIYDGATETKNQHEAGKIQAILILYAR